MLSPIKPLVNMSNHALPIEIFDIFLRWKEVEKSYIYIRARNRVSLFFIELNQ